MIKRTLMTALAWSGAAYAQEPAAPAPANQALAASDRVSYDAAFFAQFNPRTAADMVSHVPGFALDRGDNRRGFSGAVGNVLIDGVRPAAKNQSIQAILSRIPAAQVLRIELLRGAETAGDASGQAVLVNVVRTASAGDGVWEAGAEYADRHRAAPQGEFSWSGRQGGVDYGASASYFSFWRDLPGERHIRNGTRTLIERAFDYSPRDYYEYALSGRFAAPLFGGRVSANAQFDGWLFDALPSTLFTTPDLVRLRDERRDYQEGQRNLEVGLNFERAAGPWTLELIGLVNRGRYDFDETTERRRADFTTDQVFDLFNVRDSGESILRGTLSRALGAAQTVEFGAEGAFNSLDAELEFAVDGAPETVPNANILAEEERAEAFVSHTWRPNRRWSLETRLAGEFSTLTFSGDADQSVELSYWKPSIQLARNFGEQNQLRLRVYRDVGQLDFDDFASSVAVSDNRINGGNVDLRPETSWRAEVSTDLRFGEGAALSVTVFRRWLSDAADLVPVEIPPANPGDPPVRFDAPGNIGDGDVAGVSVNFAAPLAPLVPGGRLTFEGEYLDTEVTDPVTGAKRPISGEEEFEWEFEFRQDLPRWKLAWGVEGYDFTASTYYRLNEVDAEQECACADLFVESTAISGLRVSARIVNAFYHFYVRERHIYEPDRNGALARIDERYRDFSRRLVVRVSGEF